MQIQEFSNFYRLIESMSCVGLIGIWLVGIMTLLILGFILKIDFARQLPLRSIKAIAISISIVFLIIIALFKAEANSKKTHLILANQIKSGMIFYEQKEMTYDDLIYNYSIIDTSKFDSSDLEIIINKFPAEFSKVYCGISNSDYAIRLIDPVSLEKIETYYHDNLPFIKSSVKNYMVYKNLDSISYGEIQDSISEYYAFEWIELMINKYDSLFTPIIICKDCVEFYDKYGLTITRESRNK